MNLYLVQHGEAVTKDIDPERSLSEIGRQNVIKVSRFAAENCDMNVSRILHSGKLRAQQTADILAENFGLSQPRETDGLNPMDDPFIWTHHLEEFTDSVMLVGHLPHLARLAGSLLISTSAITPIQFKNGGIVALVWEKGRWALQWIIVPEILKE